MTKAKPARWPKNGRQARDAALIEATCAQRELLSILVDECDHREEYRRIGRALKSIGVIVSTLRGVEPDGPAAEVQ